MFHLKIFMGYDFLHVMILLFLINVLEFLAQIFKPVCLTIEYPPCLIPYAQFQITSSTLTHFCEVYSGLPRLHPPRTKKNRRELNSRNATLESFLGTDCMVQVCAKEAIDLYAAAKPHKIQPVDFLAGATQIQRRKYRSILSRQSRLYGLK